MQAEGVIKYQLRYEKRDSDQIPYSRELEAWRKILQRLALIGQDEHRYGGYGFGNVSLRIPKEGFLITGSQTGHLQQMDAEHYCVIEKADPALNQVSAYGPIKPSSEALTHAMIYQHSTEIQAVFHAHSPEIFAVLGRLAIPCTAEEIAYGTPEMASAVERLFAETDLAEQGMLGMLGHEDGVMTFGKSLQQAGERMLQLLALALSQ